MVQRILVPFDTSEQSKLALEYTMENFPDAEITLLHVVPGRAGNQYVQIGKSGFSSSEAYEEEHERAEELLRSVSEQFASEADISTAIESGEPARSIVSYVDENEFDLVVIGSHGRSGASRILLGSVAESVARRSESPVLIVR